MPKTIEKTICIVVVVIIIMCTFPVSMSLAFWHWLFSKLFPKFFSDKTQEIILQWFNTAKANCSVPVSEIDDYYIDPMLFIIEWNDNGLRQRNINKNNITNIIRRFPGFQSFSDNTMSSGGASIGNPSDSIFCVVDFPPMENQQINEDLIDYLRQTYYQVNQPSLGRVFDIKATGKGKFEIIEHRHVF